jgi:hypothetical protein
MKQARFFDRREFTTQALMLALSGVAITISGCAGGSSPSSPSPVPTTGGGSASDKTGLVSSNHGHRATVTSAMLASGNLVELDIRGTADHTHAVTVTMDAIQAIKAGRPVATTSTSTSAHAHTVTFNSESPDPPSNY